MYIFIFLIFESELEKNLMGDWSKAEKVHHKNKNLGQEKVSPRSSKSVIDNYEKESPDLKNERFYLKTPFFTTAPIKIASGSRFSHLTHSF